MTGRKKVLQLCLLLFSGLSLSGCWYGAAAVILASSGGSSGSSAGNNSPTVSIATINRQIGLITVPLVINDLDGDSVSIEVEVFQNGMKLFDATDAGPENGSVGKSNLAPGPNQFVWDSGADFGDLLTRENIELRVTPRDSNVGPTASSNTFQINNSSTVTTINPGTFPQSVTGNLVLNLTLADEDVELVDLLIRLSEDGGMTFVTVPNSAVVAGTQSQLQTTKSGQVQTLAVNLSDPSLFAGRTISNALLEVSAIDLGGAGMVAQSPPFAVANNDAPSLSLVDNVDSAKEVALSFNYSDAEATSQGQVQGALLNTNGEVGDLGASSLATLTENLPIRPGTLLIRYDGGRVLVDQNQGDGTGKIMALNGAETLGDLFINYSTGVFSGPGLIRVLGTQTTAVTADYNASYIVVSAISYFDLKNLNTPAQLCTPLLGSESSPFPLFVGPESRTKTFGWNALADLDFGSASFVALQVTITDGQISRTVRGNNFILNNGPFSATINGTNGLSVNFAEGDLDSDGVNDLVFANAIQSTITVFRGSLTGFTTSRIQILPVPRLNPSDPGTNLIESINLNNQPDGSLSPSFIELIDVNRDGHLDAVIASDTDDFIGLPIAPEYFANFFVYFGNGDGSFDTSNPWGPFRSGGFGIKDLKVAQLNDDNNDGNIDSNDTEDLIILNRFSHDPTVTKTRTGIAAQVLALGTEALDVAVSSGQPYNLIGNTLDVTPVLPGSMRFSFDSDPSKFLVDQYLFASFGVLLRPISGARVAYIDYSSGDLLTNFTGAPFGPLTGMTDFVVDTSAEVGYSQRIQGTTAINGAAFASNALQSGVDTITIQGFGPSGLTLNPSGIVNTTPIQQTVTFGTGAGQIESFADLLMTLANAYAPSLVVPNRERLEASISETGQIQLRILNDLTSEEPRLVTAMEVQIQDSQGNSWPLFEDCHGRMSFYYVSPNGGFLTPNLSQEILDPQSNQPLFPANFPATRADVPRLLPESPDAQGKGTAPGPGTLQQIYSLVDQTGGFVVFPPSYSTAHGGVLPIFVNPAIAPAHLGTGFGPTGPVTFIEGINPQSFEVALFAGGSPQGGNDQLPDIIVFNGDGSFESFVNTPKAAFTQPEFQTYFQIFDYLPNLYLVNGSNLINATNPQLAGFSPLASFIEPDGESTDRLSVGDLNGDGAADIFGPVGPVYTNITNLLANPPPPPLPPFSFEFAVINAISTPTDLGDLNNDGRLDQAFGVTAAESVTVIFQQDPIQSVIAEGGGTVLALDGISLIGLETGRAIVAADSLDIQFLSSTVPHSLRGQSDNTLRLIEDPDGQASDLGVVGSFDPQTGALAGSSTVLVDGALTARFDQLYQDNFLTNINLVNKKAVVFGASVSPTQLEVTDINADGLDDIVALNSTSALTVLQQLSDSPFNAPIPVPTNQGPAFLTTGNFISGNGSQEVIVPNSSANTLSIFRPDPVLGLVLITEIPLFLPSAFNPNVPLNGAPFPVAPLSATLRDLDGDGAEDLIVTVATILGAEPLSVLAPEIPFPLRAGFVLIPGRSQADLDAGIALRATTIGLGATGSLGVDFVDVNGDTLLDIAVGSISGNSVSFYVNQGGLHANGGPNFANFTAVGSLADSLAIPKGDPLVPNRTYVTPFPGNVFGVESADMNNDGFLDLVTGLLDPRVLGFPAFSVLFGQDPTLNNGDAFPLSNNPNDVLGAFAPTAFNAAPSLKTTVAVAKPADLNGDGKIDLILSDPSGNSGIAIFLNDTDLTQPGTNLTFSPQVLVSLGETTVVETGDFNGDSLVDIVVTLRTIPFVLVYFNDAQNPGRFLSPTFIPVPAGTTGLSVLDVNQDGKDDVVTSSSDLNSISILLQR